MWSESAPKRDGDVRYSFQCYVPASSSSTSDRAPEMPAGLAAQHEEYQVSVAPFPCGAPTSQIRRRARSWEGNCPGNV